MEDFKVLFEPKEFSKGVGAIWEDCMEEGAFEP